MAARYCRRRWETVFFESSYKTLSKLIWHVRPLHRVACGTVLAFKIAAAFYTCISQKYRSFFLNRHLCFLGCWIQIFTLPSRKCDAFWEICKKMQNALFFDFNLKTMHFYRRMLQNVILNLNCLKFPPNTPALNFLLIPSLKFFREEWLGARASWLLTNRFFPSIVSQLFLTSTQFLWWKHLRNGIYREFSVVYIYFK